MTTPILRMPPSPTGHLHLGTARTALFNYLYTKNKNGKILFRWEDTDQERSLEIHEIEILAGLKWLKMDFCKESPKIYRQTDNTEYHQQKIDVLRIKEKNNFVFWSPFRDQNKQNLQKKIEAGEKFVWRLRVPRNENVEFIDLIRGKIIINTETLGDFVITRNNGSVLYLLANVLDDMQQEITHVLRGEDCISNTHKQILLWQAFDYIGEKIPHYGHIPLVLDSKKRKLSKRNTDPNICVLISDFQKQGFIPEGVINGLVLLGWNPKTEEELFDLEDLVKNFDLNKINQAAAQYNYEKMLWFNHKWLRRIPLEKCLKYLQIWNTKHGNIPEHELQNNQQVLAALELSLEKCKTLSEIPTEFTYLLFDPGIDYNLLVQEKIKLDIDIVQKYLIEIIKMLKSIDKKNFNKEFIREKSIEKIAELACKNGQFLWPFRVALSNLAKSAGPFEICEVLGKKESLRRIERAIEN